MLARQCVKLSDVVARRMGDNGAGCECRGCTNLALSRSTCISQQREEDDEEEELEEEEKHEEVKEVEEELRDSTERI